MSIWGGWAGHVSNKLSGETDVADLGTTLWGTGRYHPHPPLAIADWTWGECPTRLSPSAFLPDTET